MNKFSEKDWKLFRNKISDWKEAYTDENIDQMLMERHLNKKARRGSHKNHIKGPRKRIEEDDVRFAQSFEKMIQTIIQVR